MSNNSTKEQLEYLKNNLVGQILKYPEEGAYGIYIVLNIVWNEYALEFESDCYSLTYNGHFSLVDSFEEMNSVIKERKYFLS